MKKSLLTLTKTVRSQTFPSLTSGSLPFIAHGAIRGFFFGMLWFITLTVAPFAQGLAQTSIPQPDTTNRVQVVPGEEYSAGWLHRVFFGDLWRDVWTTPITIPVLDLENYAGGLTPTRRGGGFQTQSLRLMGADGVQYKFRSLNKDPAKVLDPELRETVVADVVQDLISTANPVGALITVPILNAVNVLNAEPVLVALPDNTRLGEFREEFGGLVGMLEIHPDEGDDESESFAGADKVVGTYKMFGKVQKDNDDRVDSKAFLTARLMDIFLGDWDRHVDQWRWAGFDSADVRYWRPIPRDRDQAFCRYDGLIPFLAERAVPQIEGCDEDYPQINDLTWSGRYLDRKFLVPVNRNEWDSITNFILSRLTDSLFDHALNRLPPEMYAIEGARLQRLLQKRRDGFLDASETFYRQIAKYPDIYASDDPEYALIERLNDEQVRIRLYRMKKKARRGAKFFEEPPFFDRTFNRDHTKDIRLYMLEGDDRIELTGNVESSIQVRIIGGDGADHLIDQSEVKGDFLSFIPFIPNAENKTLFYDDGKKTTVEPGPGTCWDRSKNRPPKNDTLRWEPPVRDYGHDWKALTWLGYNSDEGLFIGGGPALIEYGFRADPYVYRLSLAAGIATNNGAFKAEFNGDFYKWIDGTRVSFYALGSQFELLNFFGFGNETTHRTELLEQNFYAIEQTQAVLRASLGWPIIQNGQLNISTQGKYTTTELSESRVLDSLRPYGVEDIGLLSVGSNFRYDSRNNTAAPTKGVYLDLTGSLFPELIDNRTTFVKSGFDARTYLSSNLITPTTLALRFAGEKIWGDFPYFESVFLGGAGSVRGFEQNRFAGDKSIWGSTELRTTLFDFALIVPGSVGIMGLADIGRVWQEGETSEIWHNAVGGGLTVSLIEPQNVLVLSVVRSEEEQISYYASFGFGF